MLGFLKALLVLPFAVLAILLAVANRGPVLVSFDPFAKGPPEIAVTVPLYALILAAIGFGILVGGMATWAAAGTRRRSDRTARREAQRLRAETERLRSAVASGRGLVVRS